MRTANVLSCITLALALALGACGNNSSTTAPAGGGAPTATVSTTDADKMLSDVSDYIKTNKWDMADKGMSQLETMKPNLPPAYGPKIDDLKKAYDTAKAAAGNMPAMSMPK